MMNSNCISRCISDAHVPVRATYKNLYKWPESDAEFVRSLSCSSRSSSSNNNYKNNSSGGGGDGGGHGHGHPRVVESISCRQLYLRSYPFSREDDKKKPEKSNSMYSCFGRQEGDGGADGRGRRRRKKKKTPAIMERENSNRCLVIRKVKQVSYAALVTIFTRLLSCTSTVDVADNDR